jgi:hypothetical protein
VTRFAFLGVVPFVDRGGRRTVGCVWRVCVDMASDSGIILYWTEQQAASIHHLQCKERPPPYLDPRRKTTSQVANPLRWGGGATASHQHPAYYTHNPRIHRCEMCISSLPHPISHLQKTHRRRRRGAQRASGREPGSSSPPCVCGGGSGSRSVDEHLFIQ